MAVKTLREISGFGSGEEIDETTTTFEVTTGVDYNSSTTGLHAYSTSYNVTHWMEDRSANYKFLLYIGGGLAILSCLFALFTYTSSRKFRVKRSHMISINLCLSLIVFYVGIVMSVSSSRTSPFFDKRHHVVCIAAAAIFQLGLYFAWTWTAVHWGYLTYTVYKISFSHISSFVIKVTLPSYGIPSVITVAIFTANSVSDVKFHVSPRTCLLRLDVAAISALNFTYLALCFTMISICSAYCIRRICNSSSTPIESTRRRIRISVTRLSIITCGTLIISILELIRQGVVSKYSHGTWLEIFNYVVLGTAGIIVSIGLTLRNRDLRLYLAERTSSYSSVRKLMGSVRQSRKNSSKESIGKRKRRSAQKFQRGNSIFYDTVRQPQLVPRESCRSSPTANTKPSFLVPHLAKILKERERADVKTEEPSPDQTTETADMAGEETKIPKINGAVSHINSFRQRMLKITARKSVHSQSFRAPATVPTPTRRPCRTQVIPDEVEKCSLSSLDIHRKTSF